MRLIDANALIAYCDKNWIPLNVDAVNAQPTIEPEKRTETNACDCISRQAVIYSFEFDDDGTPWNMSDIIYRLEQMPSAQPFHNITMNDVLKYIDRMPEDVWQEFTACLECRGWELQRRTAKWCRGEFA